MFSKVKYFEEEGGGHLHTGKMHGQGTQTGGAGDNIPGPNPQVRRGGHVHGDRGAPWRGMAYTNYDWAKENGRITDEIEYLERVGDRQDFHVNLTGIPDYEFVSMVEEKLKILAEHLGLKLDSVFKTVTYQKPKI